MKVNDTYLSRFELINSSYTLKTVTADKPREKFEIETIKLANFESNTRIQNYKNNFLSFLVYDLAINDDQFLFKNENNALKLVIFDNKLNYFTNINKNGHMSMSNVLAFNLSMSDFRIIEELNKNDAYCKESVYSIVNKNNSYVMPASASKKYVV